MAMMLSWFCDVLHFLAGCTGMQVIVDFNDSDCGFMWFVVSSTASEPLELWQQCAKQSVQTSKTEISSGTSETVVGSSASMWSGQCKGHG